MTARQIIEARIGRPLGPLATMPPDLRTAIKMLAIARMHIAPGHRTIPDRMEAP